MIIKDIKPEKFEDERKKWEIYFDIESNKIQGRGDSTILVSFILNKKQSYNKNHYHRKKHPPLFH